MTNQSQRLQRDFRSMGPTKFHEFNQGVSTALADSTRFPESMWAANPTLLQLYFSTTKKHDAVFHESMLGSKLVIAEREVLQAQLVLYLDEIASILELTAVRNPGILLASGFHVTKERRGHARAKATPAARSVAQVGQDGESGTPT